MTYDIWCYDIMTYDVWHYDGIYQKVQPLKSSTTYGLNFLITEKFNYGVEQFDYQKVQPIYFMTLWHYDILFMGWTFW